MLGRHASIPRKEKGEEGRKGKGSRHRGRNTQPHPRELMRSQGMKTRTENRSEQKERNWEWVPNPATLDHSVASYDAQGSYGEPIIFTPAGT